MTHHRRSHNPDVPVVAAPDYQAPRSSGGGGHRPRWIITYTVERYLEVVADDEAAAIVKAQKELDKPVIGSRVPTITEVERLGDERLGDDG